MDLKQLSYFLSIAEHGGFAAAARARHVSQSALSRQMQLLERDIGAKLFDRTAKGVLLTGAGEVLRDRAGLLFESAAVLRKDVLAGAEMPTGQVVVGLTPSMRVLIAGSLLENFIRRFPRVTISVIEGLSHAMADAAARGLCDVAVFVRDDTAGKALHTATLNEEPFVLVGPARAGVQMTKPVDIKFAVSHPLLISRSNRVNSRIQKEAARRGLSLDVRMDLPLHLVMDMVCRGVGYTMVPYSAASPELEAGHVSMAPIVGFRTGWVVAWPSNRNVSLAAHRMVEAVQAEFGRLQIT